MTLPVTDTIKDLAEIIGPLPPGDMPAAWWYSTSPEVLRDYARFEVDHQTWRTRMTHLYAISGLKSPSDALDAIRISSQGNDYVLGLIAPPGLTRPPSGWRYDHGLLVPRKRTTAERRSPVNRVFAQVRQIPRAADYLSGLPTALWTHDAAYPVHVRKPGAAVLAFVGVDPQKARPAFEPGRQWIRCKLSTFWLLRERQEAALEGQVAGQLEREELAGNQLEERKTPEGGN